MRASDYWIAETAEVDIFGESIGVEIRLTESGVIDTELERSISVSELPESDAYEFTGVTQEGETYYV